jgi:hypothetical protein
MRNILLLFGVFTCTLAAQGSLTRKETAPHAALWRTSVTALAVANALDIHSSWGKRELNPALSQTSATFGRDSALLKMGFQGGLMGIEYLLTRHHPSGKLYRALSFVNFGAAAAIGGVAAHNYTVPRAAR